MPSTRPRRSSLPAGDGRTLLSVHPVGPSFENAPYAQTRAFYTRMGFLPLEEHEDLEWPGPTLILVRALPATGQGHTENQDHTQGTSAPPTNGAGGVGSEMSENRWGP